MQRITKSIFDSIGACLPDRRVTTAEILEGCHNSIRLPLERLTGIRERRLAGDGLYSIDLARGAVERCLKASSVAAADYDLIICTNISRRDAANAFTCEPTAAIMLKEQLGLSSALAFDLSNACAGMWTGVYIADALIRTGEIKHAMVVSGEYISYLIETAQREIVDFMDPQIASLTLGDAGVAVSLGLSPSPEVGLHDLDLYTLSKYSPFCIAKPTDQAHGGAVMYTDAIKVTEAVVPHAAQHAKLVVDRNGWPLDRINHIVPHQTSQLTMQEAKKEIGRLYDYDFDGLFVNNLAERGNTSSNSHFLALLDSITSGRIKSGDDLVFCISGSGQTTGTALYTCDRLPERLTENATTEVAGSPATASQTLPIQLAFDAIGLAVPEDEPDTLDLLETAAELCLADSVVTKDEVDLVVSVGTYRTEFVMEPAIAALAAGRLHINEDRQPGDEHKSFAFDLLSGPLGFLKSCYLAGELVRAGSIENALILASEVENNRHIEGEPLLGLVEQGSASLLRESTDDTGFLAFHFEDFTDEIHRRRINAGWNANGKAFISPCNCSELERTYLDCLVKSAERFLAEQQLTRDEIAIYMPPQLSATFADQSALTLGLENTNVIVATDKLDLATSSVPVAYRKAMDERIAQPGDLALIASVGAGIQVGLALYQF